MKVAELSGALLDYWVLRAEGWVDDRLHDMQLTRSGEYCIAGAAPKHAVGGHCWRSPSTDWAVAGPLIDREGIGIWKGYDSESRGKKIVWEASTGDPVSAIEISGAQGEGPTPLVAAMRAFVRNWFGKEVPDV